MKQGSPAQQKPGLRIHVIAFFPSIALLLIINLWTGAPYWVQWLAPAWVIGLFSHWFFVLGPGARKAGTR
jgi:hypothetical protein